MKKVKRFAYPAFGKLYVTVNDPDLFKQVQIMNKKGELLHEESVLRQCTICLDIHSYSKGDYLIKLVSKRKIIVQNLKIPKMVQVSRNYPTP